MKIEKNKHYILKINLFGRIEKYIGQVLSVDKDEFRFETEEDNKCRALTLNQKDIIYSKEIPEPKKVNKVHKISTKKQFTNLKPSIHPKF